MTQTNTQVSAIKDKSGNIVGWSDEFIYSIASSKSENTGICLIDSNLYNYYQALEVFCNYIKNNYYYVAEIVVRDTMKIVI